MTTKGSQEENTSKLVSFEITDLKLLGTLTQEVDAMSQTSINNTTYNVFTNSHFEPLFAFESVTPTPSRKLTPEDQKKLLQIFGLQIPSSRADKIQLNRELQEIRGGENEIMRKHLARYFAPGIARRCNGITLLGDCAVLQGASKGKAPEDTSFFFKQGGKKEKKEAENEEQKQTKEKRGSKLKNQTEEGSEDKQKEQKQTKEKENKSKQKTNTYFNPTNFVKRHLFAKVSPDEFCGLKKADKSIHDAIEKTMKDCGAAGISPALDLTSLVFEIKLTREGMVQDEWYSLGYVGALAVVFSTALSVAHKQKYSSEAWFSFPIVVGLMGGVVFRFREVSVIPCIDGPCTICGMKMRIRVRDLDLSQAMNEEDLDIDFEIDDSNVEHTLTNVALPLYETLLVSYSMIYQWLGLQQSDQFTFVDAPRGTVPYFLELSAQKFTKLRVTERNQVLLVENCQGKQVRKTFKDQNLLKNEKQYMKTFYPKLILGYSLVEKSLTLPYLTSVENGIDDIYKAALGFAQSLRTIHEAGWNHNDVKPSNMYTSQDGFILLDGEFATVKNRMPRGGSPAYAAPELGAYLENKASECIEDLKKCDVYSFGLSLIHLAVGGGKVPDKENLAPVIQTIRKSHGAIADIFEKMTATNAHDRPDMAEVVKTLQQLNA